MRFTINVEKRFAYAIIGAMLILAGIFAVTAFGTSNPQVFGHTASEVAPGVFGGDNTSVFSFPGSISITNDAVVSSDLSVGDGITLGGVRRTSWPASANTSTQTAACSWSGYKCHCNSDSQGSTQMDITIGLQCLNGVVNDIRVASQPHTSVGSTAGCPSTKPTWCDIYSSG